MRAVMFDRYGDASVLGVREAPEPAPGPGEIQVRVLFASLNPIDFKLRNGLFRLLRKPTLPAITGKDFAGRVSALGAGVQGFEVGQRVFGSVDPMAGRGSCAENIVIGIDLVAATPEGVADAIAACLPVAAGSALQALTTIAGLRAGQSLLVTGASGAVGASAVQIARSLGAHITGVCSATNAAYVRGLGATTVIDYQSTDWRSLGQRFDVIFDAAGSASFGSARPHLAPTGCYLSTNPTPGLFVLSRVVGWVSRQRAVPFMLKTDAAQLRALGELAERRVLQPHIAQTVRLEDVATAQRQMQAGQVHGKICVRIAA